MESFELDHFSFQSTPSAWRETCRRHGGLDKVEFQSTPSAWRETIRRCNRIQPGIFQSTPSAWRETTTDYRRCRYNVISIHSLRMEGDYRSSHRRVDRCISIHSLRMEGDLISGQNLHRSNVFQSTPSAWRETKPGGGFVNGNSNFNPLPPHGGRHREQFQQMISDSISIHSLRMEGDHA